MDRVKRRWFEKLVLVGAAYNCTWCGRRQRVSRFSHDEPATSEALSERQLAQAKQTFGEDARDKAVVSAESDRNSSQQPVA